MIIIKFEKELIVQNWLNISLLKSLRPKKLLSSNLEFKIDNYSIIHLLQPNDLVLLQLTNFSYYYEVVSGLCIRKSSKFINSSFILRSFLIGFAYEKNICLFSPLLVSLFILTPGNLNLSWKTFNWRLNSSFRKKIYFIRNMKLRSLKDKLNYLNSITSK